MSTPQYPICFHWKYYEHELVKALILYIIGPVRTGLEPVRIVEIKLEVKG